MTFWFRRVDNFQKPVIYIRKSGWPRFQSGISSEIYFTDEVPCRRISKEPHIPIIGPNIALPFTKNLFQPYVLLPVKRNSISSSSIISIINYAFKNGRRWRLPQAQGFNLLNIMSQPDKLNSLFQSSVKNEDRNEHTKKLWNEIENPSTNLASRNLWSKFQHLGGNNNAPAFSYGWINQDQKKKPRLGVKRKKKPALPVQGRTINSSI